MLTRIETADVAECATLRDEVLARDPRDVGWTRALAAIRTRLIYLTY